MFKRGIVLCTKFCSEWWLIKCAETIPPGAFQKYGSERSISTGKLLMDGLELDAKKRSVIYVKTDIPTIEQDTDIVIKVAYAGICGTDLHIISGEFNAKDHVIMGHEMSGTIAAVPENCKVFNIGDKVVVNPNKYCGYCSHCQKGLTNLCTNEGSHDALGVFRDGAWAQYCKAHISQVHKIPESLTLKEAVLCEPISCIVHGLDKMSPVYVGSNILVIGAGIIGILWCNILHALGHKNVYISEPNSHRREYLNNLGFGYTCLEWGDIEKICKSSDVLFDHCVDCSGNEKAMSAAIPFLAEGGKMNIFGVSSQDAVLSISPFKIFKKELTIMGSVINTSETMYKALRVMESIGRSYLDFERLGIKLYTLETHKDAFADLRAGKYSKVIFAI